MIFFLFLGPAAVRDWKQLVVFAAGIVACRNSDMFDALFSKMVGL